MALEEIVIGWRIPSLILDCQQLWGHGKPEMANWLDLSDDFCQWPKMESQVVIKVWKDEAAGARRSRGLNGGYVGVSSS